MSYELITTVYLNDGHLHLLGFGPRTASAIRDLNKELYGKPGNVSQ